MFDLQGKVALVTGASRGVGKGIAMGLCEAGATVYITGRTKRGEIVDGLGGSVFDTAIEAQALGGQCIPFLCDHRDDIQTQQVFETIFTQQNHLDILVNNVWAGYQYMVEDTGKDWVFTWENPFWEQPRWRWDAMFNAGVRAHYVSSQLAAKKMIERRQGLIVNISFWAAQKYIGNAAYGIAKAASDQMAFYMAHELKSYGVTSVSLYPGLVRTESVLRAAHLFDMRNSESPQFIGRAIAAMATDPNIMQKTGQVLVAASLGLEYGFTDIDGKQPKPLTLDEV
jgi:NAD(P)-dependent dehydrogenase (short-subunit alcohol dehydrogenase family)